MYISKTPEYISTQVLNDAISSLEAGGGFEAFKGDEALCEAIARSLPTLARIDSAALGILSAGRVLVSNSPDELIFSLVSCYGNLERGVLIDGGGRSSAKTHATILNRDISVVARKDDMSFDEDAFLSEIANHNPLAIFLASPCDPVGTIMDPRFIERVASSTDATIVIDETYGDLCNSTALPLTDRFDNICVLRSLTYARGVSDFQISYAYASEQVASKVRRDLTYHLVDAITQAIGIEICKNLSKFEPMIKSTFMRRRFLFERLNCLVGIRVIPSGADFLLIELSDARSARSILESEYNISLEDISDICDPARYLKVGVGSDDENLLLLEAISDCLMRGC